MQAEQTLTVEIVLEGDEVEAFADILDRVNTDGLDPDQHALWSDLFGIVSGVV